MRVFTVLSIIFRTVCCQFIPFSPRFPGLRRENSSSNKNRVGENKIMQFCWLVHILCTKNVLPRTFGTPDILCKNQSANPLIPLSLQPDAKSPFRVFLVFPLPQIKMKHLKSYGQILLCESIKIQHCHQAFLDRVYGLVRSKYWYFRLSAFQYTMRLSILGALQKNLGLLAPQLGYIDIPPANLSDSEAPLGGSEYPVPR